MKSILQNSTLIVATLSMFTIAHAADTAESRSAEAVPLQEMVVASDVRADKAMQLKESGQIMPLRDLIEQVSKDYPGRIIEVELEEEDGRYVYEMEIVNEQGVVTELDIDAGSGKVLKVEEEYEDD